MRHTRVPAAALTACVERSTSSVTAVADSEVRRGWLQLCDPTAWPWSTTALTSSGCAAACSPVSKNVALTPLAARIARIRCVVSRLGPSSKVSATALRPGIDVTLRGAGQPTVPGAADRAAEADTAPVAALAPAVVADAGAL